MVAMVGSLTDLNVHNSETKKLEIHLVFLGLLHKFYSQTIQTELKIYSKSGNEDNPLFLVNNSDKSRINPHCLAKINLTMRKLPTPPSLPTFLLDGRCVCAAATLQPAGEAANMRE